MRIAHLLAVSVAAGLMSFFAQPAAAHTDCDRTEKKGCIEIDVFMAQAPDGYHAGWKKPYGPQMFRDLKSGALKPIPGASVTLTVFVFGDVDMTVPVSLMAEYKFRQNYADGRKGVPLARYAVREVNPGQGPQFDPVYNIGQPKRAFQITTLQGGAGAAIQFPRSMFGKNVYILICAGDNPMQPVNVYPDRTRNQGYWFTPEDLAHGDYVIAPFYFQPRR